MHALGRHVAAEVGLHDEPGEPQLIANLNQPVGHHLRAAVGYPIHQQVVVGGVQQLLRALEPFRRSAGAFCFHGLDVSVGGPAECAHGALLGVRTGLLHGFRHVDGHPDINVIHIVAIFGRGRPVQFQILGHLRNALAAYAGDQRESQLADDAEGIN